MQVYPLESIGLEEAIQKQFHIVDCMTKGFTGSEVLTKGDLGVVPGYNQPLTTAKAEQVIADIFHTEAAMLVRGAGSGAIRMGLHSMFAAGERVLIHKAPVYPTTEVSLNLLGLKTAEADYNQPEQIRQVLEAFPDIKGAVIQYTRQKPDDSYEVKQVIRQIKSVKEIPVLTDDNYAIFKVPKAGVECGGDLSCFSSFKLLGPEGIGVIAGKKGYLETLRKENYSGGMQVQGWEALEGLRGFAYAPVSLAIQARAGEACVRRLKQGEVPGVKQAFLANAQSKVVLVEFCGNIAKAVLLEAEKLGAAPYPVGSESRYEVAPMFYRISGTFRAYDKELEQRMIRINPMRAGDDTVIRILKQAVERVIGCS